MRAHFTWLRAAIFVKTDPIDQNSLCIVLRGRGACVYAVRCVFACMRATFFSLFLLLLYLSYENGLCVWIVNIHSTHSPVMTKRNTRIRRNTNACMFLLWTVSIIRCTNRNRKKFEAKLGEREMKRRKRSRDKDKEKHGKIDSNTLTRRKKNHQTLNFFFEKEKKFIQRINERAKEWMNEMGFFSWFI